MENNKKLYVRAVNKTIQERLAEPRRLIHVLSGPRQVGKTTAIRQVLDVVKLSHLYAAADQPNAQNLGWLEDRWGAAREMTALNKPAVLVIDEIQKIPKWSDAVKALWDEDTLNKIPLLVVLLGSSPLLMQSGLTESLAGRFETIRVGHWSYRECREYFGWDLDTFIFYGGYPGAAVYAGDFDRWQHYVIDSLIEPTVSRDILMMTRIDKPALFRRLFNLSCEYSGQILSYSRMMGQLQDAGNTTTLAHYLDILDRVSLVTGLQKYSGQTARRRGSSPKLAVWNTALVSAIIAKSFEEARADTSYWGHLTESAVSAHLLDKTIKEAATELFYWRDGLNEVDFVFKQGADLSAIEVKSGKARAKYSGLAAFGERYPKTRKIVIGGADGKPLEEFLLN